MAAIKKEYLYSQGKSILSNNIKTDAPDGILLVRSVSDIPGKGLHRHGWPWVVGQLKQLESTEPTESTLLFDDYIEKTFETFPNKVLPVYNRPWAGIFHEPPDIPDWLRNYPHKLETLFKVPEFRRSLPYLRCAFTLSDYLARPLRKRLTSCPVHVLRHPAPQSVKWSPDNFRRNHDPSLLQFGFYMRNTHISLQVPPCTLRRVRYLPTGVDWINWWDNIVTQYWRHKGTRRYYKGSDTQPLLSDEDYDRALASNVLITEVFAASANNLIVECIVRGTPLLVNRHPAVVEYLGANYPFYFKAPEEIPDLLQLDRIIATHKYLTSIPKEWIDPMLFVSSIQNKIYGL